MDFKNKIISAPMAGITDRAYRVISRRFGADICISEMISSLAVHYEDKKTASLAHIENDDMPIGLQIFGHDPEIMKECASYLSNGNYKHKKNDLTPSFIDINMGCPVKKIISNGDGSALMKNPRLCGEIISSCVEGSSVPVTVKIRAGWSKSTINCTEIAKIAEASGASAITIHARTREQMYEPFADWDIIKSVKKAVSIPVIGNGDVFTANDCLRMFEETGVDSVMIGRGSMGNPFIFEEIKCLLSGKKYIPYDTEARLDVAREHIRLLILEKGEKIGVCEARKHLAWYTKGMRFSSIARGKINSISTEDEVDEIIEYLKKI